MYIEDLFYKLTLCEPSMGYYDAKIVDSIARQLDHRQIGFTEKQSTLAVSIVNRYSDQLSQLLGVDVRPYVSSPKFKLPIRTPCYSKIVSIVDHSDWGKAIKLKFPFDSDKISIIQKNKLRLEPVMWDGEQRAWFFGLSESNILFVSGFIKNDQFSLDEEFKSYMEQIEQITESAEDHVPMLVLEGGLPKYKNVSKFVPDLVSKDIVPALFEARNAGIFSWDEHIDRYVKGNLLDPFLKQFLLNQDNLLLETSSLTSLTEIIAHSSPVLFVIPGGGETQSTKALYNFLIDLGYSSEQMSVLFRRPTSTGREFNEFVKSAGLNNPITETTRFVFISTKLPKTVLKSQCKIRTVISLGTSNVHYTIRAFLKNRHNLIYYSDRTGQLGLHGI